MNYKKAYFCGCTPLNNNIVAEIQIRANTCPTIMNMMLYDTQIECGTRNPTWDNNPNQMAICLLSSITFTTSKALPYLSRWTHYYIHINHTTTSAQCGEQE